MAGNCAAHRSEREVARNIRLMAAPRLYAAIGRKLIRYAVDVERATLVERDSADLPAGVQYAWPDGSKRFLYAACSDGRPGRHGSTHCAVALRIDGDIPPSIHGDPVPLPSRPVHISTDRDSRHVLIVYPVPSALSVRRIEPDGRIGGEVEQDAALALGKTAHQILVTPDNDRVVVPVRGNDAAQGSAEYPGALEIFAYRDGRLTPLQTIAPHGGYGFGPRHVDFHPSRPWMYMSIERQNELAFFEMTNGRFTGPRFRRTALAKPAELKPRQLVGTIHVHPNGRFVYVSNRADGTVDVNGAQVFNGGENSIAVFAVHQDTGEPTLIQSEDTRGMYPRTFHIDPSGRLLVVANMVAYKARVCGTIRAVSAGLSVFRIRGDGRLEFVRKYDLDVADDLLFWAGMA